MAQVLTIAEINAQFDSEWVLVEDPQTNDQLDIVAGTVLAHSKDRDELFRLAGSARPKRFAVHYTGELPEDAVIII